MVNRCDSGKALARKILGGVSAERPSGAYSVNDSVCSSRSSKSRTTRTKVGMAPVTPVVRSSKPSPAFRNASHIKKARSFTAIVHPRGFYAGALALVLSLAVLGCSGGDGRPAARPEVHETPSVVLMDSRNGLTVYRLCDGSTAVYLTAQGLAAVPGGCLSSEGAK